MILAGFRLLCYWVGKMVWWTLESWRGILSVNLGLRTPEFEQVPVLARLRGSCSTIWVLWSLGLWRGVLSVDLGLQTPEFGQVQRSCSTGQLWRDGDTQDVRMKNLSNLEINNASVFLHCW